MALDPSCNVANTNPNAVAQDATIALQPLYKKLNWLGCAGNPCGKAGCPRLFMEGIDWDSCWGEAFRKSGPGTELEMLLGFITLANESGLVEEVEKQDALVTTPCHMVLSQHNTGAAVMEKCTRYMLEGKELEKPLKIMMPLQSTTSMLSVGLDW